MRRETKAWSELASSHRAAQDRFNGLLAAGHPFEGAEVQAALRDYKDFDHMSATLRGWDMSLWDTRPPCPRCGELQHFMASTSRSTPMRPLLSAHSDPENLPAQAWLAGWTGRR